MTPKGHGAILLTGATASIKGYARSAAFAMGKFALRALAQSAARELGPKGIHVAHFVIDGGVRSADVPIRTNGRTAPLTLTASRRPMSKCFGNREVPGPSRLKCGPGSRRSDRTGDLDRYCQT